MIQFKRELIDNITQVDPTQITRENLRYMHGIGQEIASKNSQGNKISRYRVGVQTPLGDIEVSLWMELVQKLIEQENDQEIFNQLLEWGRDNNYIQSKTKNDLLRDAMQSYTYRIYDNKGWWDYVRFNRKYRLNVLDNDPTLIFVRLACCGSECRVPPEQIQHNHEAPDTVPCPFCNRYTVFSMIQNRGDSHENTN